MQTLYLGCLTLGVLFAVVSVVIGDLIGSALHGVFDIVSFDFLNPTLLAGGITVFGGAGMLLNRYSGLEDGVILALSLLIAAFMGVVMHLVVVKPMRNSEMSSGFSMSELPGRIGEVTIPVPGAGYGEIMVKFGASNSLHTAASFEQQALPAGIKVVVVEVREGVALVSEFEERRGVDS
ncbi:protease [Paenibacillus tritici]|jgi:membrane-bound ClpP family serine protease|uniref:protease n=1 Tax=Paenibacillus tritici TaxID=1873425 RepID=UPI001BAA2543|nr:protease [Paenibacillus tritici]QUL56528.1 protease [Paenibacillus tritici]